MTDTAQAAVGGQAPAGQQLQALGRVKDLMRAVNPARIDTQCIGGVEQVAHGERAVFQMRGHAAVDQHHHNGLGAIEGVTVAAHDLGVEL